MIRVMLGYRTSLHSEALDASRRCKATHGQVDFSTESARLTLSALGAFAFGDGSVRLLRCSIPSCITVLQGIFEGLENCYLWLLCGMDL